MKVDFLPEEYQTALAGYIKDVCEVRLRVGEPVKVRVGTTFYYLTKKGRVSDKKDNIICSAKDIEYVIRRVTEHSLYAHNERIKQGFLDAGEGIRIGLAGECVFEGQAITTIKNISSLNIRIPHEIYGCSNKIYDKLFYNGQILNGLIVSPPLGGKTTVLKDLARKLSIENVGQIVIVDERGEFGGVRGENIDKIVFSDKRYAFEYGIRTLTPNIIITDELSSNSDWQGVYQAINSGVSVIASCHAKSVTDLIVKNGFIQGVFDRYAVLSSGNRLGDLEGIFDKDMNEL